MDSRRRVVLTFWSQSYSGVGDSAMNKPAMDMDKATIELLARRAGLDKALAQFPEDVVAAATQAAGVVQRIRTPVDPRAEPWPPMRAGDGL